MATEDKLDRIEAKVLDLFQRFSAFLRKFWKSFLTATESYLRSKTKYLPAVKPQRRREIVNGILDKKHHQDFLQKFALESGVPLDHVEETLRRYLHEIAADVNYLFIPFVDFLLTWTLETIYEGFEVDTASLEKLRSEVGQKAIVLVANHRSHMDYLLVPYLLYHHRIPIPHVCAGANLSFWPLGPISRKLGGFFIRRSYEGNRLYAFAVQAYMEELIRNKTVMEFFIEGTRSRTGKLLPPRMGILSSIVQAYLNGAAEEILLVPTSVTYESVLEEKAYVDELAGASKKQEGFWDLLKLRKYLGKKKGKAYVQFGEPVSARDFLKGTRQEEKKEKVQQLAYELTYGINKSTVVTPGSLVATGLLTHPRRSIPLKDLEEKVDRYLDYLRFKESRLSEPLRKYRPNAVREAVRHYTRDHLIEEYQDEEGPLYRVREERRSLLDYYKNASLHFFVSMGVFSTIVTTTFHEPLPIRKIEEDYLFLQDLFQYEFTFSRRQGLRSHVEKLIEYLEKKGWVRFDGDTIELLSGGKEALQLFSSPLRNFFESYFILWKTLPLLRAHRWEEKELLKFVQERGRILYFKEEISLWESVSKFSLRDAISSFRDQGIFAEEREGWGRKRKLYYTVQNPGEGLGRKLSQFLGKN